MNFTAEIPLPPDGLSPNARLHWAQKAKATRLYREACAWIFREALPKPWDKRLAVKVDVQYRACRGCNGYHPRDEDNARASLKAAFDALKDAGAVASDAKRRLTLGEFSLLTTARELKQSDLKPGITLTVRQTP